MTPSSSSNIEDLPAIVAAYLTSERAQKLVDKEMGAGRELLEQAFHNKQLPAETYCRALVGFFGWDILNYVEVRRAILVGASDRHIDELSEFVENDSESRGRPISLRETKINRIADKRWFRGGRWPNHFVKVLNLPWELAQKPTTLPLRSLEVFEKRLVLGNLHGYQRELYELIVNFLIVDKDATSKRAMVSLPTGAGKTRVVVECLADLIQIDALVGPIIWVAQTEELCEQAVRTMGHVWNGRSDPPPYDLIVQRVWGGLSQEVDFSAHAIVTTPESFNAKLEQYSATTKSQNNRRVSAIIIDEAHLSLASEYKEVFNLGSICGRLIGMTATPGRSTVHGNQALARRFQNNLFTPPSLEPDPIDVLTKSQVLAKATFSPVQLHGEKISLTEDEAEHFEQFKDYKPSVLKRIGSNERRNRAILDRLISIDTEDQQTLVFASSVSSARWLAGTMSALGRTAAVVDSATARSTRSSAIDNFNRGMTQFLFNYQVLAQGFDAPKVANIVIARPVNSIVLMEQMLGRGLRGIQNGGTAECQIIYFDDIFEEEKYRPRGYAEFKKYWDAWSESASVIT